MNQPDGASELPTVQPPDPDTATPKLEAPPGACDTHCHVFGPAAKFPVAAMRRYTPRDCLVEDYRRMAATIGFERAVLVQASAHGTDNRATLDAIARAGAGFRGVAIVDSGVTDHVVIDHEPDILTGRKIVTEARINADIIGDIVVLHQRDK